MTHDPHAREMNLPRRAILQAAGSAIVGGLAISSTAAAVSAAAQSAPRTTSGGPGNRSLGARLQGVQHFGLTVQNMERAYEFYTEVLGGTKVFFHGDFQGDGVQNTLLADQEILANELKVDPQTLGIPDLRSGQQRLDVRFIQFDNVVIELLQYRNADQPMGGPNSFAEPSATYESGVPADDAHLLPRSGRRRLQPFIHDLEAESARRGMTQVKANRVIRVRTEQERLRAPQNANTNKVTEAPSDGWELIYCKGPEGEQLEFVKALGGVKQRFANAVDERRLEFGPHDGKHSQGDLPDALNILSRVILVAVIATVSMSAAGVVEGSGGHWRPLRRYPVLAPIPSSPK